MSQTQIDLDTSLLDKYNRFYQVRNILTVGIEEDAQEFLYLIYDKVWLHPFRAYISSKWKPLVDTELIRVISRWSHLMPDRFVEKLSTAYLLPRLERCI